MTDTPETIEMIDAAPQSLTLSADAWPAASLFLASGRTVMTFCPDGRVEIGEWLAPDEAGRKALEAMAQAWPDMLRPHKDIIDALSAALEDCLRYIEADERSYHATFAAGHRARAALAAARGETPR
jgi:hypothetical protein